MPRYNIYALCITNRAQIKWRFGKLVSLSIIGIYKQIILLQWHVDRLREKVGTQHNDGHSAGEEGKEERRGKTCERWQLSI